MASFITLGAAVVFTVFLAAYGVALQRQSHRQFEFTKDGKIAMLFTVIAFLLGAGLLVIRNWPWEVAVPLFWVLFPLMALATLGGLAFSLRGLRTWHRPLEIVAFGANAISVLAMGIWIYLPRFIYG